MKDLGELPKGKYIEAVLVIYGPRRNTAIYGVVATSNRSKLGLLKWYSPWRKYCFFPEDGTVFDARCLKQIAEWITELNKRHKERLLELKGGAK